MALPIPAQAPVCSVHPDQLSAGTCPRCGRFACGECLGDGAFCHLGRDQAGGTRG